MPYSTFQTLPWKKRPLLCKLGLHSWQGTWTIGLDRCRGCKKERIDA